MSYEDYWNGDPYLARTYKRLYQLKQREINNQLWLQGAYIKTAIDSVMDSRGQAKYPKEPFDIGLKTEDEKKLEGERQKQKVIEMLTQYKKSWDRQHK